MKTLTLILSTLGIVIVLALTVSLLNSQENTKRDVQSILLANSGVRNLATVSK